MNIKTEIKEYGFPVTHNCVRSETRITELEAKLVAAQADMQAMVDRLTTLDAEWQTIETYDKTADGVFETCARRLREAISGQQEQQEQQVGMLEIADDVIAEREAAKGER